MISYIDLLNSFSFCVDQMNAEQTEVTSSEIALFYGLASIWNRLGRMGDWIAVTNKELSRVSGMSPKTIDRTRSQLVKKGLINFIPSENRKAARYCVTVVKETARELANNGNASVVKQAACYGQNDHIHREERKKDKPSKECLQKDNGRAMPTAHTQESGQKKPVKAPTADEVKLILIEYGIAKDEADQETERFLEYNLYFRFGAKGWKKKAKCWAYNAPLFKERRLRRRSDGMTNVKRFGINAPYHQTPLTDEQLNRLILTDEDIIRQLSEYESTYSA